MCPAGDFMVIFMTIQWSKMLRILQRGTVQMKWLRIYVTFLRALAMMYMYIYTDRYRIYNWMEYVYTVIHPMHVLAMMYPHADKS